MGVAVVEVDSVARRYDARVFSSVSDYLVLQKILTRRVTRTAPRPLVRATCLGRGSARYIYTAVVVDVGQW